MITAADVTALGAPLLAGVKANIQCWPIAVERVRYVGEPVAVVVAADRYLAEDALELIEVDYAPLPITLRPADALKPDSAVLHDGLGSQHRERPLVPLRDPEAAFARAAHRVSVSVNYPRNPARRSKPTGWSPTTIRARTPTTCWRPSRGRSASTRCWRAR